jgi:hypothetical protein
VPAHRAFLSLLQYSPDPLRAEAVNVGAVLLDPATGRVGFRAAEDFKRARKAFGWASVDTWWLGKSVAGVRASLLQQNKSGAVKDEAGLRAFAEGLGGELRLTAPRPVPVHEFEASLQEAFDRLVHTPQDLASEEPAPLLPVAKPLDDAFRTLKGSLKRVGFGNVFPIEGLGYKVRSDYDYRNGTANLVRLLKVGDQRPASALRTAIELGGEGVQVRKHLVIDNLSAKLLIVVTPVAYTARVREVEEDIEKLAADYPDTEYLTSARIPELAQRVLSEAK